MSKKSSKKEEIFLVSYCGEVYADFDNEKEAIELAKKFERSDGSVYVARVIFELERVPMTPEEIAANEREFDDGVTKASV